MLRNRNKSLIEHLRKLPLMQKVVQSFARLQGDRRSESRGRIASKKDRTIIGLSRLFAVLALAVCIGFVTIQISSYENFPPESIYQNEKVFNLTDENIKWDVYYGDAVPCGHTDCHLLHDYPKDKYTKSMVLPAREFPLIGYKQGQLIYLRANIPIPDKLKSSNNTGPLMLHSFWIWANKYEMYVNGKLVEEGEKEVVSANIPRQLIDRSDVLHLAFKIDSSGLPYQGIAHRGDLLIGPKSMMKPLEFSGQEEGKGRYLWFLLPKITFCIMFAILFLVFNQNLEFLMFIGFSFFSILTTFLISDYSEILPSGLDWYSFSVLTSMSSNLFFILFIKEYFKIRNRSFDRRLRFFVACVISVTVGLWLGAEKNFSYSVTQFLDDSLSLGGKLFGCYCALAYILNVNLKNEMTGRKRIAYFFLFFFLFSLGPTVFEIVDLIKEVMGLAEQNVTNNLNLITELVFFLVLSTITSIEFGMTQNQKEKFESDLQVMEERLSLGQSVQSLLFPKERSGSFGELDYSFYFKVAEQMSGDWIYVWNSSDGQRGLLIGDVVGKGPQAAVAVSAIISFLSQCEKECLNLGTTIFRLNAQLFGLFRGKINTTLAALTLEDDSHFRLFNCGGQNWVGFTDQGVKIYTLRNNALGYSMDLNPESVLVDSAENFKLFAYTDGVMDGSRSLAKFKRRVSKLDLKSMSVQDLYKLMIETGKGMVHNDDMTIVSIERQIQPVEIAS